MTEYEADWCSVSRYLGNVPHFCVEEGVKPQAEPELSATASLIPNVAHCAFERNGERMVNGHCHTTDICQP